MQTVPSPNGPGDGAASHGSRDGHSAYSAYSRHGGVNGNAANSIGSLSNGMATPAADARANGQQANASWSMFPRNNVKSQSAAAQSGRTWDPLDFGKTRETQHRAMPFSGWQPTQPAGLVTPRPTLLAWSVSPTVPAVAAAKTWPSASTAHTANTATTTTNTAAATAALAPVPASSPSLPSLAPLPLADHRPTPVFKNPLDTYASPPPASKRQRTGHTAGDTSSSDGSDGNPAVNNRSISPPKSTKSPTISRSQPPPTPAAARRTGSWNGSSPMTATQRLAQRPMAPPRPKVPSGFKQSVENNKVVYVLDDGDGGGDGVPGHAKSNVPTPTQPAKSTPETPPAPLLSSSAPPTLNNIAPPPASVLSHAPSITPAPAISTPAPAKSTPAPAISTPVPATSTPVPAITTPVPAIPSYTPAQPLAPAASQPSPEPQHVADRPRPAYNPATAWLNPPPTATTHNDQPPGMNNDRLDHGTAVPSSMAFKSSPTSSINALSQVPAAPGHADAIILPRPPYLPSSLPPSLPPSSAQLTQYTQYTYQTQPSQTQRPTSISTKKSQPTFTRFANLDRRPYLQYRYREFVTNNSQDVQKLLGQAKDSPVIHVDFLPNEVQAALDAIRSTTVPAGNVPEASKCKSLVPEREIKVLLRKKDTAFVNQAATAVDLSRLPGRSHDDIIAFFADVRSGKARVQSSRPPSAAAALALCRHDRASHSQHEVRMARASKTSTLLFSREMVGQRILAGRMRQPVNVVNEIRKLREDSLTLCHEWTNCAGDVITISWTSNDTFICGTTTHMDDRNHQYNRQGNLAIASLKNGRLTAYPDHRVARRPQIESGYPNTTHLHDDPWLYTSVVSSDFTAALDLAFTSSFDQTVKAWRVEKDGTMRPMGSWPHKGKVNFVVASTHEMGLVATAADVSEKSARIYRLFDPRENGRITYKALPCPRIFDAAGRALIPDKWAYLPAAVRWGLSKDTNHLLLVGFSPRGLGLATDDEDIPADRRDTGELRLWDGRDGSAWQVNGPRRNVFEVAWHPSDACFIAATAAGSHNANENVRAHIRTQIRVYRPANTTDNGGRVYAEVQTLDCFADDINELALLPNSFRFMFVAAGATNGKTYVWDTSQGDSPVHILEHGKCLEELAGERISTEDTGIKFVAWGQTPDRLYTGSSDGLVKVWNVRTHRDSHVSPFVRDLLHCPGPVSFGAFSPNNSKLAIGDASGRVFVLSVNDSLDTSDEDGDFLSDTEDDEHAPTHPRQQQQQQQQQQQCQCKTFKQHPPEIIRHPTPPPPPPQVPTVPTAPSSILHTQLPGGAAAAANADSDDDDGCAPARKLLASGQILIVPDRTVGAVKGPNYAQTGLYCRDFHLGRQIHAPLLAQYDRVQQENQPPARSAPSRQRRLGTCTTGTEPVLSLHDHNRRQDLTVSDLKPPTLLELRTEDRGAIQVLTDASNGCDEPYDFGFDYEELPATL